MKKSPIKKAVLLTLFLLLIVLCSCGNQYYSPVEDFSYEFIEGTVKITGYNGSDLDIVVPNEIEKRPVTIIGKEAFQGYDLNTIVLPENLLIIENNAFNNCTKLNKIVFPNSLERIENYAFSSCKSLEDISIPENIKEISCDFTSTKWFDSQPNGVLYSNNIAIGIKGDNPETIKFTDGTKRIVGLAYINTDYLEEKYKGLINNVIRTIVIPESVEFIQKETIGYKTYISHESRGMFLDDKITIRGKSNSYAKIYADENDIRFLDIDAKGESIDGEYVFKRLIYPEDGEFDSLSFAKDFEKNIENTIITISGTNGKLLDEDKGVTFNFTIDADSQELIYEEDNSRSFYTYSNNELIIDNGNSYPLVYEKK